MFDISFSELLVIAVVALLVIGPEKLPKVARTMGAFLGRMQRYTTQIKDEVNREMRFEELQKLQQEVQHGAQQVEAGIQSQLNAMDLSSDGSSEQDSSEQDSNAGVSSPTEIAAATVTGDIVAVVDTESAKTAAVKTAKKRISKPKSVDASPKSAILNDQNTSTSTKKPRVKNPSVV